MVTPGLRAVARRPPLPLQRPGQPGDRRGVRAAGDQRPVRRSPAARPWSRSATPSSPRCDRPRATSDHARLLGRARPRTLSVPEGVEVALLQAELARRADRGPALAARLAGRERDGGGDPAGGCASRSCTGSASQSPEALAGITTLRGIAGDALLRPARPRHRPQPELGRDRLPGPGRRRPTERERPLRDAAPERRRGDDRGRRLHRRLRRRRRRDRRRAGGGGQVGRRARDGRLPTTTRLRRARALRLPAPRT